MGLKKKSDSRFIHTKHVDESGAWYVLDNAGIIMPPVTDARATGLFRFELYLSEDPDRAILQKALAKTANRFPYFNVHLKRGFFWYYFEQCRNAPLLEDDSTSPSQGYNINKKGLRMFRIRVQGKRISAEFSHALTDGAGAMTFMKTLLAVYCRDKGYAPDVFATNLETFGIMNPEMPPSTEEYEDAYQRYFPGKLPPPEPNPKAWHLREPLLPKGEYRIIEGIASTKQVLDEAKKRGVTMNELLGAVYLDALQEIWFSLPRQPREHFISLEIPVNLRKFFPSRTHRNFSLFILLSENLLLGKRDFEELVQRAHYQMKLENDPRSIARQITRNAGSARNLAVRLVPLFMKDFFARILFAKFGETMLSGFISNLGSISLPDALADHVERFVFIPAPSPTTQTNASVIGYDDQLVICFGSLSSSRELEKNFFRRLRSLGIRVAVRCRNDHELRG